MSCHRSSESEQLFSEIAFSKQKVEEKEPKENTFDLLGFFAKSIQREPTKLSYSFEKCHLPIAPCFNLSSFPSAGNSCWGSGDHLFPSIWSWGKESGCSHFCEILPLSPHGRFSSYIPRPQTLTSLVVTTVNMPIKRLRLHLLDELSTLCGICKLHNH